MLIAPLGCSARFRVYVCVQDVAHNRVARWPAAHGLGACGALRRLSLRHNRLAALPPGALAGLTSLRALDLGHNALAGERVAGSGLCALGAALRELRVARRNVLLPRNT